MTYSTVLPMWHAVRSRFSERIEKLTTDQLSLKLGDMTIGQLIYHTAEVEYIFADWYFDRKSEEMKSPPLTNKEDLIQFLHESNEFFIETMKKLPEEKWHEEKKTRMGSSTPLEVVGRLMYHTGIHSGQISDIEKYGQ